MTRILAPAVALTLLLSTDAIAQARPGTFTNLSAGSARIGGPSLGSGSQLEVRGKNGLISTVSDSTDADREGAFISFLKMADGEHYKAGVFGSTVADSSLGAGFMAVNLHASFMESGVQRDNYVLAGWGNHGAAFFPSDVSSDNAPGAGRLRVDGQIYQRKSSLGSTSTDGVVLQNITDADARTMQFSPRLRFTGRGWRTGQAGASVETDFMTEVRPVPGSENPTANLVTGFSLGGGPFTDVFRLSSAGEIGLATWNGKPINGSEYVTSLGGTLSNRMPAVNYVAESDGVVTAFLETTADNSRGRVVGMTGGAADAQARIAGCSVDRSEGRGIVVELCTATFYVKKGDYWRVDKSDALGSTALSLSWRPIGARASGQGG